MNLSELLTDAKAAIVVASTTTGTGVGTIIEWIPEGIGKLGTLVGIILSIVLIYTHSRKFSAEHEKTMLEIDVLKQKARKGGRG